MNEDINIEFCRLLHSLLRHSSSPEEVSRAKDVAQWLIDNSVTLRAACEYSELEVLKAVYDFNRDEQTLPTPAMLRELVLKFDRSEEIISLVDEYTELAASFTAHGPSELNQVLADKVTDHENRHLTLTLKLAGRIASSSITDEKSKRKLSGAKDAIHYFMGELERGILINREGTVAPLIVQKEADGIGERYDRRKTRGHIETGVDALKLYPSNFLGVLGYGGGGKSTFGRFICYCMAAEGRQVYHVSLENDAEVEADKYVLLHCHHPKWQGQFAAISYEKFLHGTLTAIERRALEMIAADFRDTISGNITIVQPQQATWEAVKQMVELHSGRQQVDVLLIDYLQLLLPNATRQEDGRTRMTAMVKDVRQFGLTHRTQSGEKLLIVSPIQANESGRDSAENNDGIWQASGINEHKELLRSCDKIVGVWSYLERDTIGNQDCMLSCVKDRDGIGFTPTPYKLSRAGWVHANPFKFGDEVNMDDCLDPELA